MGLIIKLNMNPISIMGRQHRSPVQIPICPGPDRVPWREHMNQAEGAHLQDQWHPVDLRSTDPELTEQFSRWSRAAENCLLGRTSMDEAEARKCRGRGQAPRYEIKEVLPPNKVGAYLANPDASFWGMLKVRLQELVRANFLSSSAGHRAQMIDIGKWVIRATERVQEHIVSLGGKLKDEVDILMKASSWRAIPADRAGIAPLLKAVAKIYQVIVMKQKDEKTNGFRKWVETALLRGAKAAHRFTSSDDRPEFIDLLHEESNLGPLAIMEQKADFWLKYWDPERSRPCAPEHHPWMLNLRRKAEEEAG
jgi:hypothetical protein